MLVLYGQHHWVYNCTSASCFIRWRVYVRVIGRDILLLQHCLGFSSLHHLRTGGTSDLSSDVTPSKQKLLRLQKMWVGWFTPPQKNCSWTWVMYLFTIGGSGGRQGHALPLGVQILSFSCSFYQKVKKIIPLWELTHPPRENPGSATGSD